MDEVLLAAIILMIGVLLGSGVGIISAYIWRLKTIIHERREKFDGLVTENMELKEQLDNLQKTIEYLEAEKSGEVTNYSDAFAFTQAVLDGKEDFE